MLARHADRALALIATSLLTARAPAQGWEYFVLPPTGADHVVMTGTGGGRMQAGYQTVPSIMLSRAAVWTGTTPAGFVDTHPVGATSSYVWGSNGEQHVGQFSWDGSIFRAGLWTGVSNVPLDLHLPQYLDTSAIATDGVQQVGAGYFGPGMSHALLWQGSAASASNLNPAGALMSWASGVAAGRQVGWARFVGVDEAGYWTGTAASWTSLHPGPPYASSRLGGVSPDGHEQAGSAWRTDRYRACLWHSTPQTFVDLHPDGVSAGWSEASATEGEYQVGYVERPSPHAAAWRGTPESFYDLHALLPSGFAYYSYAAAVARDPRGLWVVGYALRETSPAMQVGIVWHLPDSCGADCNADGSLTVADFGCFQTRFVSADPYADCNADSRLTVADFGCFQTKFVAGCP